MTYALLHIVHLLAGIMFIGAVFFEVLVLARITPQISTESLTEVQRAIGERLRVVLHWVVLFVYGAGIALAWQHRSALAAPWNSSFGTLLMVKILLAIGVFLTFGLVAILLRSGRMTAARRQVIHWAIFVQMLGIVVLAKGMFYFHW